MNHRAPRTCRGLAGTLFATTLLMVCLSGNPAPGAICELPMSLDYPLLSSLVLQRYYNDLPGMAKILDQEKGCRRILLSKPSFGYEDGNLIFETRVDLKYGKRIFGTCLSPVAWSGDLVLRQEPRLQDQGLALGFTTIGSRLLTLDRQPASVAEMVWTFLKDNVYAFLGTIRVDLAPPVKDMKNFLIPVLSRYQESETLQVIQSIRAESVSADETALTVTNRAEIPETMIEQPGTKEAALTEEEIDAFVQVWETWDSFLVTCLMALVGRSLDDHERQTLLDVILETRHTFIAGLEDPDPDQADFVRDQFVRAWTRLSPIFRRHLTDGDGKSLLGYLAFFTAADALVALDAVGPGLGMEISREGLSRLIRMLVSDSAFPGFLPDGENPRLRELLGLPPRPEDLTAGSAPAPILSRHRDLFTLLFSPASAFAGQGRTQRPLPAQVAEWLPEKTDRTPYLARIRGVLGKTTDKVIDAGSVPRERASLFRLMVPAAAWQESCFKHYRINKDGTVGYVRSYNNSSVGLMQINERVWKGIYDIPRLRWDIDYNALAGCEILGIYVTRYALRYMKEISGADSWEDARFAGSVYAMYNGGPREFSRYQKRYVKKDLYKSDSLFSEKFQWVVQAAWDNISACF